MIMTIIKILLGSIAVLFLGCILIVMSIAVIETIVDTIKEIRK